MSFGYSVGDAVMLTQLAWKTVKNTQKACGEHDELTQEVLGLHLVLRRLEQEISKPDSPLNRSGDSYEEEIETIIRGCSKVLRVLDTILEKYNRLSEEERSWRKLWQKIRFGNGEITDLQDLRSKMVTHTAALSLTLNMASLGSLGRIEKQMKGNLQEIKTAVNGTAARLIAKSHGEGSVLSTYTNDDKAVWKEFRGDLCKQGFSSSDLKRHRGLIMAYITELGDRGLFDDVNSAGLSEYEDRADGHEQLPADHYSSGGNNVEYPPKHMIDYLYAGTVPINFGAISSSGFLPECGTSYASTHSPWGMGNGAGAMVDEIEELLMERNRLYRPEESVDGEGSVLTTYTNNDESLWKDSRDDIRLRRPEESLPARRGEVERHRERRREHYPERKGEKSHRR